MVRVKPSKRGKLGASVVPGRVFKLTTLENGIMTLERLHGTMQYTYSCLLKGPEVTVDLVQDTWRLVQKVNPMLRLTTAESGKNRFHLVEQETFDVDIEVVNGRSMLDVWQEYARKPMVLGKSAAVTKIYLVRPGESEELEADMTYLSIVFNHAFSDGVSASNLLAEFLAVLANGEAALPEPRGFAYPYTVLHRQVMRKNGLYKTLRYHRHMLGYTLTRKAPGYFKLDDESITYKNVAEKCECSNLLVELSRSETSALLKQCKERNVTVGALVGAALVIAARRTLDKRGTTLGGSVAFVRSVRPDYIEGQLENIDLGFHVSSMKALQDRYVLGVFEKSGLWGAADFTTKYLQKELVKGYAQAVLTFIHFYWKRPVREFTNLETVAMSNWGRMPLEREYKDWTVERAYPLTAFNHMPMPTCFVSTAVGRLSLNVGVAVPLVDIKDVRSYLEEAIGLIKQAAHTEMEV